MKKLFEVLNKADGRLSAVWSVGMACCIFCCLVGIYAIYSKIIDVDTFIINDIIPTILLFLFPIVIAKIPLLRKIFTKYKN